MIGKLLCHLLISRQYHIYASMNRVSIGSGNGLSWNGILEVNFNEIAIEIHIFLFKKMHLKISCAKMRPCCRGGVVLVCWVNVNHSCILNIFFQLVVSVWRPFDNVRLILKKSTPTLYIYIYIYVYMEPHFDDHCAYVCSRTKWRYAISRYHADNNVRLVFLQVPLLTTWRHSK